jgi:hypothetical protein
MLEKTRDYYRAGLSGLTNEELVEVYNGEVGLTFGIGRAEFPAAIQDEFETREIDYSEVGDDISPHFDKFVSLTPDAKLVTVSDSQKRTEI